MKLMRILLSMVILMAAIAVILLTAGIAKAQAPQLINYQAVARNSSGNIIVNQAIGLQLTIHNGSGTGTVQYRETQTVTTNAYGLFTLQIGAGTAVTGNFSAVTWSSGAKYLQVEMDPSGGGAYTDMGTQQLVSVPYAFYTDKAASAASLTGNVTMAGDVTGINSATTVVKLQGKDVSTTAPAAGQVLQWTGIAWAPAAVTGTGSVTSISAGAGLSGGTITTSGTISMPAVGTAGTYGSATQVPVITTDAQGRVSSVINTTITGDNWGTQTAQTDATLAGNGTTLTPLKIAQQGATTGQALEWNGTTWLPATIPAGTTYTSGTGINIAGTTINALNTTALWNANELQGKTISTTAPASGQGLVWSGSAWTPTTLSGTTYTSGTGINIVGSVVNAQNTTSLWNANELQGNNVSATAPATGQGLVWSGSAWAPTTLAGTTYTSGTGVNIVGSVVNAQNTTALWNANELQGNNVSATAPASGQGLVWSGSSWAPATLPGTTYTSGTGISIVGSTISAQNGVNMWNASQLQGNPVSAIVPTIGQVLQWSGIGWFPTTITGTGTVTSITAGAGLSGGTITTSGTVSMPNVGTAGTYGSATQVPVIVTDAQGRVTSATNTTITGDGWGAAVAHTDVTLAGNGTSGTPLKIAQQGATTGQALEWNGTSWVPTTIPGTTYTSGTGINIVGTVVNAQAATALWNANELQGNNVSSTAPTVGQVLSWSGSAWTPTTATGTGTVTSITAGAGLSGGTITSTGTISMPGVGTAGTYGSATQVPVIVTDAQGRVTSVTNTPITGDDWGAAVAHTDATLSGNGTSGTPLKIAQQGAITGQVLSWNGTSWVPTASTSAGWGLTGNAGTNPTTNFIGTTDAAALRFRVNNLWSGEINNSTFNTAFGAQSIGGSITTGTNNTGIGYHALSSNTSGSDNVATGSGALYANNTGANNTAIGYAALNGNTSGGYNTATGYSSLQSNTTGTNNTANGSSALSVNSTGNYNAAFGYGSLAFNTTGSYNTATGASSLAVNTTGSYNNAGGYFSLYSNTTGGNNSATGYQSLYGNTTGSGNVATGYNSLYLNTTGYSNVAIGISSLRDNTTGSNNVAVGDSALYSQTTAVSGNVAIGSKALFTNTSGTDNAADGYQALYFTTTGVGNTAHGYQSLYHNTTGANNVALGLSSLYNMTTGSGNTGVGTSSYPSTATLSNWNGFGYAAGGGFSTSNSVELGNTSITVIRAEVTGITAISDGRIKDNVRANVPGLDFIDRLRPVTYNLNIHRQNEMVYKNKKDANKDWEGKYDVEKITMSGFIAQEVDKAAKDAGYDFCGVERPSTADGLYGIRYTDFIMPLVKSVQELNAQNGSLQKTVETQNHVIEEQARKIENIQKEIDDLNERLQHVH